MTAPSVILSRRTLLGGLLGASALTLLGNGQAQPLLGLSLSEEQVEAGRALLRRHASIDVHAHPGRFFLRGVPDPSPRVRAYGEPFEAEAVARMRAGHVSGALFSGVADMALLDFSPTRGLFANREFAPGEAWADYRRQIGVLRNLVAAGTALPGRAPADIARAHAADATAAIFSVEGGDFIEDRLGRVAKAYGDGVRAITIVHYHINQIGDIQTEPERHGGLTPLGRDIVCEMNRAGIIIDLAHATYAVTRDAAKASTRPMILSHSNISTPAKPNPRLIGINHARLVADHGGVVGSVPWGIGQASFDEWISSIFRLVDAVGVDHAAIGTDMDANYMPVFTDYRLWHLIPAALLARGMVEGEVAKIMGGNFLRVFAATRPD